MLALVASADGVLDPRPRRRVAGRSCCSRAASTPVRSTARTRVSLLRELFDGSRLPGALGQGHRGVRAGVQRRRPRALRPLESPNQRGPEQMGWRTKFPQNLNLNCDYVKAEAPEMRAMLGLLGAWDPILYVDLHVTDGAQFQSDISVQVEPCHGWEPVSRAPAVPLRDRVLADLGRDGFMSLPFYPSFMKEDHPSPASTTGCPTRATRPATGPRATGSRRWSKRTPWKPYPRRVAATHATIPVDGRPRTQGTQWLAEARGPARGASPRRDARRSPPTATPTAPRRSSSPGYAYSREPSAIPAARLDPLRRIEARDLARTVLPRRVPEARGRRAGPRLPSPCRPAGRTWLATASQCTELLRGDRCGRTRRRGPGVPRDQREAGRPRASRAA